MSSKSIPKRLYKYRAFSNRTLEMLIDDSIHFADPSTFNDPLDSSPALEADLPADGLAQMLLQLVEQRVASETFRHLCRGEGS